MGEFDLITKYFAAERLRRDDIVVGIGDDGAVLRCPPGMELVVAIDTLVEGIHFPADTAPADVGFKSLAVNLSDLAAMGAEPAWATLALTMPRPDEVWVADFCQGFFRLAQAHGVALVGGDTTRGPLTISVQAHGWVPAGQALRRRGAQPGDLIYVSGTLGDAGLGLAQRLGRCMLPSEPLGGAAACVARLNRPEPRVALGRALRGLASAAIDISDGLSADLGHVLERSGVGARLEVNRLPQSEYYRLVAAENPRCFGKSLVSALPACAFFALTAGDDYELCFTIAAARVAELESVLANVGCAVTCIGLIDSEPGLRLSLQDGHCLPFEPTGYAHF